MLSFLVRAAFWLMILVLLLPTDEKQQTQVYGTAEAAVKDVSAFCERNPGVCEQGKSAFDLFVHKAQFGAELIIGFVKEQTVGGAPATQQDQAPAEPQAPAETLIPDPSSDPEPQAAIPPAQVSQTDMPAWVPVVAEPETGTSVSSQNTLKPEDKLPAWSGPRPGA